MSECEVVLGTVTLTGIDATEADYMAAFANVVTIQGDLVVEGVDCLTSLRAFGRLEQVGDIVLRDNANLVSGVLPSLKAHGSVAVDRCSRLCAARYPGADAGQSTAACTAIRESQYLSMVVAGAGDTVSSVVAGLALVAQAAGSTRCTKVSTHTCRVTCSHMWMSRYTRQSVHVAVVSVTMR